MTTLSPYLIIADDDPDDVDIFCQEFACQNPGVPVKVMGSGNELLEFLNGCDTASLPAVLLLDYQMKDINGPQVLEHLAADPRFDPMVKMMWSSSRRTKDVEDCMRLGAVNYFVKPGSNEELDIISRHISVILELSTRPRG